jgi:hypothetical protein
MANVTKPHEKATYVSGSAPGEYDEKALAHMGSQDRRHSVAGAEASDVYGNAQAAEEYGYVERGYVSISLRE